MVLIVEFTTDRIHRDDTGAYLTIDRHPVLLPPTLARLIDRLIASDAIQTMIRPGAHGPAYLFPGRPPGRPRHPHALREMGADHGLPFRTARNTAMITAAGELPSMVMSDLLGIDPGTAEKWKIRARRRAAPDRRRTDVRSKPGSCRSYLVSW